jgi:integrase/recombinase XerD
MVEIVDGRRAAKASTATIRRDLTAMSSVLGYAEDQDWIEGNPALARLRRLKERRNPIVLPQAAHIERVIKRAPGLLATLTRAALVTGCRQDELVKTKQPDLDRARRQLTVIGKGNKVRVVDLDFEDGFEVFRSLPVSLSAKWLFWHDGGKPYRQVSSRFAAIVKSVMVEAQKEAQLAGRDEPDFRPFRFHDLRHVHAVRWLKSGRSIYDLQGRLGHASIKTTEIYLAFLTPEEARAVKYGGVSKGTTVTSGLSS